MNEEEKKAIEIVKEIEIKDLLDSWDAEENYNAIQVVLNLITKRQKEIENKDKIIDLMVKEIFYKLSEFEYGYSEGEVKEYFRKKVENEK